MATFECTDCGTVDDDVPTRCPDCAGVLNAVYDYDTIDLTQAALADRDGTWKHHELLPFVPDGIGEGTTPLVAAPRLADELGVGQVFIKNEAHNPTGTITDRAAALVAAAAERADADTLALPTTGNGGQSAAAYAARAGLLSRSFVPSRANFINKAMINVHGGDMRVVEGRYDDAREAYQTAREELPAADEEAWFPAGPFDSPFRHEGLKPLYYELVEQLDWTVPDAVVAPTGHGEAVAGLWKGAREFESVGLTESTPRLYAAQPDGCAPIVDALDTDSDPEPWSVPDTVVGSLEIPDPAGGLPAVEAVRASGGEGVAVDDQDLLDSAATVAQHEGLEVSIACGAAAAGAWDLAEEGAFDADDTVVLVNTGTGNKDADIVRSRLMSQGI
ncbi:threonine synthase [Natronomonas pharaonis DSM 2160]|uniref:Threonine synthase n=1 Tax=Natronomonas pharaonis (strain ATCC 35678 / DSM 2160 / CIP 103997 / JCM 8858 / NBRC 14720 / NCIMB 2260 / Gabara) TaxID=348780 RepID=A0A1U7EV62_NATPD|nr:pyridoxal-phosphate dependent enzyme [Natronomonas pharaonis]CAI48907.1 threonine synthase [Natronomonas pharaonis DSM 2160]